MIYLLCYIAIWIAIVVILIAIHRCLGTLETPDDSVLHSGRCSAAPRCHERHAPERLRG